MIVEEIIALAGNIRLMMDIGDFRKSCPGVRLSTREGENLPDGPDVSRLYRVSGNHQILTDSGTESHWFFTFDSGCLTSYEVTARCDSSESHYGLLTGLYNSLFPIFSGTGVPGREIHPLIDYHELEAREMPAGGYPCDRYVIGAMHRWEDDSVDISLSIALVNPGYLFFQARAVVR